MFEKGERVAVRCCSSKWKDGMVEKMWVWGLRVWIEEDQGAVTVPQELIPTHVLNSSRQRCCMPSHQTPNLLKSDHVPRAAVMVPTDDPAKLLVLTVRPSHLAHRLLFHYKRPQSSHGPLICFLCGEEAYGSSSNAEGSIMYSWLCNHICHRGCLQQNPYYSLQPCLLCGAQAISCPNCGHAVAVNTYAHGTVVYCRICSLPIDGSLVPCIQTQEIRGPSQGSSLNQSSRRASAESSKAKKRISFSNSDVVHLLEGESEDQPVTDGTNNSSAKQAHEGSEDHTSAKFEGFAVSEGQSSAKPFHPKSSAVSPLAVRLRNLKLPELQIDNSVRVDVANEFGQFNQSDNATWVTVIKDGKFHSNRERTEALAKRKELQLLKIKK